jgi:hypothetical protein
MISKFHFLAICIGILLAACSRTPDFNNDFGKRANSSDSNYNGSALRVKNLESILIGLSPNQVEVVLGKPEGISTSSRKGILWDYRRPVLEENSGKVYDWSLVTLTFNKVGCTSVSVIHRDFPKQTIEH